MIAATRLRHVCQHRECATALGRTLKGSLRSATTKELQGILCVEEPLRRIRKLAARRYAPLRGANPAAITLAQDFN
jgi:hypothetical protein